MCRLAAYAGPPRSLHSLWLEPEHNLEVQSYAPRQMKTAILNADGFGMAWYTEHEEDPALYRTVLPLWADVNVRAMSRHLVSGCAIANVRSATIGMPTQLSNVSPFVDGRWTFTHNGFVRDFHAGVARRMRETLDDKRYAAIVGNTDSEHLHAVVMARLDELEPGRDPTDVVAEAVAAIIELCGQRKALLNLIVTDGDWLVAVRHAIEGDAPSLYRREVGGAVELVSEPLDEDGWEEVPAGSIVTVRPTREVMCRSL